MNTSVPALEDDISPFLFFCLGMGDKVCNCLFFEKQMIGFTIQISYHGCPLIYIVAGRVNRQDYNVCKNITYCILVEAAIGYNFIRKTISLKATNLIDQLYARKIV